MSTQQLEDDDIEAGLDPLDVVEHVLAAENLSFDRTEDGDLAFALAGDWKDYELWFAWRPEVDCLQLCLSIDMRAPKTRRAMTYELLSLINQRIWLGHFEVWVDDGEIVFRHALSLPQGERPTLAAAATFGLTNSSRARGRSVRSASEPSKRQKAVTGKVISSGTKG